MLIPSPIPHFYRDFNRLDGTDHNTVLPEKTEGRTKKDKKAGLLSRTVLLGALVCSLSLASSATTSYAWIGSDDAKDGETGCSSTKSPDAGSYDVIIGGKSTATSADAAAQASGNTLELNDGHKLDGTAQGKDFAIAGGYAVNTIDDTKIGDSAKASSNTVKLTKAVLKGDETSGEYSVTGGYVFFYHGKTYASENKVNIIGGDISYCNINGAFIANNALLSNAVKKEITTSDNNVTIENANVSYLKIYGSRIYSINYDDKNGTAVTSKNNDVTVVLDKTTEASSNEVCGSYVEIANASTSNSVEASYSTVTLTNGTYSNVYGSSILTGCASASVSAVWNEAVLTDVTVKTDAAGGEVVAGAGNAEASHNTVTMKGGSVPSVYGGYTLVYISGDATADSNTVSLTDVADAGAEEQRIAGGFALVYNLYDAEDLKGSVSASGNTLNIKNTKVGSSAPVYGGYARTRVSGNATANGNNGTLTNVSPAEEFVGAYAGTVNGTATANENKFSLNGGTYADVFGGEAKASKGTAAAKDNELAMSGLAVAGTVYGGKAGGSEEAAADGNRLLIYGGTYQAEVYAGYSTADDGGTASAEKNTVSLNPYGEQMPNLEKAVLWGGYAAVNEDASKGKVSGNSLEFHQVQGLTAVNIKNFDNLTYELADMKAGASVLTLTGGDAKEKTIITGATVQVAKIGGLTGADGGEFQIGDKVYLLQNASGIESEKTTLTTVNVRKGATIEIPFAVKKDETSIFLTRTGAGSVLPGTKAIAEGAAAGLALVSEAANTCLDLARNFSPETGIVAPFMHVQGSSVTHETGSSVHLSSVSLVVGVGTGLETGAGKVSAGAFFEYGKGSYTTNNTFDNAADVNGDGTSWYMGAGILAKMEFLSTGPGHFYVEGSAHMGQLHNEYDSSDLRGADGRAAGFDMDSPYYALHGGLGYVWNITEDHDLDVYGKYIWTRVDGTDETLTTGDKFEFDDMDSSRVRFGARYTYKGNERFKPYAGVAYEHEFAGSCDSKTFGHSVAAPSFEGDTGIGELGITMAPSESLPLSINLGVQGYVGQKRGVSGSCMVKYEF